MECGSIDDNRSRSVQNGVRPGTIRTGKSFQHIVRLEFGFAVAFSGEE